MQPCDPLTEDGFLLRVDLGREESMKIVNVVEEEVLQSVVVEEYNNIYGNELNNVIIAMPSSTKCWIPVVEKGKLSWKYEQILLGSPTSYSGILDLDVIVDFAVIDKHAWVFSIHCDNVVVIKNSLRYEHDGLYARHMEFDSIKRTDPSIGKEEITKFLLDYEVVDSIVGSDLNL